MCVFSRQFLDVQNLAHKGRRRSVMGKDWWKYLRSSYSEEKNRLVKNLSFPPLNGNKKMDYFSLIFPQNFIQFPGFAKKVFSVKIDWLINLYIYPCIYLSTYLPFYLSEILYGISVTKLKTWKEYSLSPLTEWILTYLYKKCSHYFYVKKVSTSP